MNSANVLQLRNLLDTSNFRQAATIAYICLLVALFTVVCSGWMLEAVMHAHVKETIQADVRAIHQLDDLRSSSAVVDLLTRRQAYDNRPERRTLVVDAQGKVLFGDASIQRMLQCQQTTCLDNWRHYKGNDQQILGLVVNLGDGGHYLSAYDVQPMLGRTRIIPLMGGAGVFTMLLGSLFISLRYSLRSLYRIDRIHDALKRFASGDHQAFPPHDRSGDELDRLAADIYRNLERINLLMAEVKGVTSHVAHELKTPLTRLQNRLVSAAEKAEGQMREELLQAAEDGERIHGLFRAVMRIGEVETGRCAHQFEVLSAEALLQDLYDYYQPLAEERGSPLLIDTSIQCLLWGDRALLFQALANLADNALKYSPPGSTVRLFARSKGSRAWLGVADHGPGIPQAQMTSAVQRFKRLAPQGDVPGNGLGLTLVQAIAELHNGQLQLLNNAPGLCAQLELPGGPADASSAPYLKHS